MLRKLVLLFVCTLFSSVYTFSQVGAGTVKGTVKDESGEPLPFVNVGLFQNGVAKGGAPTDINGKFIIQGVTPGNYDEWRGWCRWTSKDTVMSLQEFHEKYCKQSLLDSCK